MGIRAASKDDTLDIPYLINLAREDGASVPLTTSEKVAIAAGSHIMSLIVTSENVRTKWLYEHTGYRIVHQRSVVAYEDCLHSGD